METFTKASTVSFHDIKHCLVLLSRDGKQAQWVIPSGTECIKLWAFTTKILQGKSVYFRTSPDLPTINVKGHFVFITTNPENLSRSQIYDDPFPKKGAQAFYKRDELLTVPLYPNTTYAFRCTRHDRVGLCNVLYQDPSGRHYMKYATIRFLKDQMIWLMMRLEIEVRRGPRPAFQLQLIKNPFKMSPYWKIFRKKDMVPIWFWEFETGVFFNKTMCPGVNTITFPMKNTILCPENGSTFYGNSAQWTNTDADRGSVKWAFTDKPILRGKYVLMKVLPGSEIVENACDDKTINKQMGYFTFLTTNPNKFCMKQLTGESKIYVDPDRPIAYDYVFLDKDSTKDKLSVPLITNQYYAFWVEHDEDYMQFGEVFYEGGESVWLHRVNLEKSDEQSLSKHYRPSKYYRRRVPRAFSKFDSYYLAVRTTGNIRLQFVDTTHEDFKNKVPWLQPPTFLLDAEKKEPEDKEDEPEPYVHHLLKKRRTI